MITNSLIFRVLEAGLEPAQPQWPRDFKSRVSTDSTTRATWSEKRDSTELFSHDCLQNFQGTLSFFAIANIEHFLFSAKGLIRKCKGFF